jgi:FkbM family methyltransferase
MKFYGQFDPPVDKLLFERYFKDYDKPGFFVECGAFDGITECSCKFFEETLHWEGINIEPSPRIFEKLKQNRPESINLNVALSNIKGMATFKQVIHPDFGEFCTNGSLCHTPEHFRILQEYKCEFKDYPVHTITWEDLVKENKIKNIDLFVLDVEGAEMMVIESMRRSLVLPRILCIEHSHCGGSANLQKVLENLGYDFDFSSDVNSFFIYRGILRNITFLSENF